MLKSTTFETSLVIFYGSRDNADRMTTAKNKKDKTEFLETIKDCEYLCARLEKLVSPKQVESALQHFITQK